LERVEKCKSEIQESTLEEAVIVHHDEADGLTSAALTKLALERLGLRTQLVCLDKLYPEVVSSIESGKRQVIACSDIGSGHIDWLSTNNRSQNIIVVLDHHDTVESTDPCIMNLNPELDGFSGEKEASSATVAYLFARTVDDGLRVFSHLGLVGSMEVPGEPQGLNELVVKDAEDQNLAKRSGRDFKIEAKGMRMTRSRAVTLLNVLGSVGYYQRGPEKGVHACTDGFEVELIRFANELEEKRKIANRRMLDEIKAKGLVQLKSVQWFHARDNYTGMSGKVVGSFCSYLRYQSLVNPMKYLVGMMNVPADIPGWGKLPAPLVKVSGRAPQPLAGLIEKGKRPALSRILPEACSSAGGFGDGHSVAASGVFPLGREEMVLSQIDALGAV
jgi:single-stranded DNA-specific DHH superfamily exonuclease